jgi:hypothetical protein
MWTPETWTTIESVILYILAILIIIIFLWAIYSFFIAIFQFIFSKWDAEKVKKAWNNIRYMILWIILTILLLFIFPYIMKKLEISWYKNYNAKNIFKKVWEIFNIMKSDKSSVWWSWIEIPDNSNNWDYINL